MSRKLTKKQQQFADSYVKDGNATKAALEAGYSKHTARSIGQENLTKPDIKSYINECMKKIESDKIMDSKEALELLTRIARGTETETVFVPLIQGGVAEEEKEADLKTRISATKEILKRYPGGSKLIDAQTRKANADADIAEAKAKIAKGAQDGQMDMLDKLLNKISGDTDG